MKELLLCPRSRPVSTTVNELDMESVIPVLSRHLFHSSIQTRVTAFRWVYNLFLKTPNKVSLLQRLTLVFLLMFHYKCCFLIDFAFVCGVAGLGSNHWLLFSFLFLLAVHALWTTNRLNTPLSASPLSTGYVTPALFYVFLFVHIFNGIFYIQYLYMFIYTYT